MLEHRNDFYRMDRIDMDAIDIVFGFDIKDLAVTGNKSKCSVSTCNHASVFGFDNDIYLCISHVRQMRQQKPDTNDKFDYEIL